MSAVDAVSLLGIDVGGTFTDLVWHEPSSGTVALGKGMTNPDDVAEGVCEVLATNLTRERLEATGAFLHAHTVGLNTLLQRSGASVGLLTTAGFRDVLEIRRGDRESVYDVLWRPSDPLVPRWRRLPVRERMRSDGTVLTHLQRQDVLVALAALELAGVECIAVVYLNAHANPAHETLTREILVEAGYDGEIALSHEISGEYREFERSSTTVVDAYVRPTVSRYLGALEQRLRAMGFSGKAYVSRSGAGVTDFASAARRPFESIMSGPAAGVVGTASLSRRLGTPDGNFRGRRRDELRHERGSRWARASAARGPRRRASAADVLGRCAVDRRRWRIARVCRSGRLDPRWAAECRRCPRPCVLSPRWHTADAY